MTTAALAVALCLLGGLLSILGTVCVWILTGMRDDLRALSKRVGEHDAFITAFKMQKLTETP
jgi:hypothetical protein